MREFATDPSASAPRVGDPATPAHHRLSVYGIRLVRERTMAFGVNRIGGPADSAAILREYLGATDRESCVVLLLSTKNRVIGIHTVSVGDLSSSIVHPREVYKTAIAGNAFSVILGHNHPSGDPAPSAEDLAVTRRLADAGEILGIPLLDHVIIGDDAHVSLKEMGIV